MYMLLIACKETSLQSETSIYHFTQTEITKPYLQLYPQNDLVSTTPQSQLIFIP